jgi:integrase
MEQAHQFVAQIKAPYLAAVWLLILAGLRPAELCGPRVGSVDFVRGVVHVSETLLPVHKFGDEKYQSAVLGPPKTDAGDRRIPIPRWLCTDLSALLAERAERRGSPTEPGEYLFQTRYGNRLNRDKLRENVIRPALVAAGLPETIRTYDLRHSHASLLIDLGANVLAVAQRMGHSDPVVTLREYGHLFEGVQDHLSAQLDELRESTKTIKPSTADIVPIPKRNAKHEPNNAERSRSGRRTAPKGAKAVDAVSVSAGE